MRLPGKTLFSPPKPEIPSPPPPLPTRDDPAIAARTKEVRDAERRRKGRQALVLTSGLGLPGAVNVARPTAAGDTLGA